VHDFEAVGLEPAGERLAKLLVHRSQRRLKERAPVAKIQQPHLDPPSFQVLQHVRSLSDHDSAIPRGSNVNVGCRYFQRLNLKRVSFLLTGRVIYW
jgi:hypothetical protein